MDLMIPSPDILASCRNAVQTVDAMLLRGDDAFTFEAQTGHVYAVSRDCFLQHIAAGDRLVSWTTPRLYEVMNLPWSAEIGRA